MKEKKNYSYGYLRLRKATGEASQILIIITGFFMALFIGGCTKNVTYDPSIGDPLKAGIASVVPSDQAGGVFVDPEVTVTFLEGTNPSLVSSATITLKKGDNIIPGTTTFSETAASFSAATDLDSESDYVATINTKPQKETDFGTMNEYSWKFRTGKLHRIDSLKVVSVTPGNKATAVSVNTPVNVTFNHDLSASMKSFVAFLLKKGSSTINGAVTFDGKILTFQPGTNLEAGSVYTGSVIIGSARTNDDKSGRTFVWSFTTAGAAADIIPPSVSSVVPVNASSGASTTTKVSATFSEPMKASTLTGATFTVKQGTTSVTGTVTYSGSTATFSPSAALSPGTVYTATITKGVTDVAGNALAANYTWSFTTAAIADVTPPTIVTILPVMNATAVAVGTKVTVTFSEAMDANSITSSTFTLKQGSASVTGSVVLSGAVVTFTPSVALLGNTIYTATITTGVKDLSGNQLASNYTWSFTTAATVTGKSFAADVMPILNICNTCHTHGWTPSATASTFYTNVVNAGYINTVTPTSGKIYTKLNGGHPPGSTVTAAQKAVVLTWITEGSKNN